MWTWVSEQKSESIQQVIRAENDHELSFVRAMELARTARRDHVGLEENDVSRFELFQDLLFVE